MGRAQTEMRAFRGSDCIIDSQTVAERSWKDRPKRVKAPYTKGDDSRQDPEYHDTRGISWEDAGTTP